MFKNKACIMMSVAAMGVAMTVGVSYAAERGIVTADSLNVRSGPSTSYSIKAKIPKGTIVTLGAKSSNGWYEVTLDNGVVGWASGHYIDIIKNEVSNQGEITGATYLRKEANWSAEKIALLNSGVKVQIVSSDANWTKVKFNDKTGYIANQCIKTIQSSVQEETQSNSNKNQGKITAATYLRKEANWSAEKIVVLDKGTDVDVVSINGNWVEVKYLNKKGYISADYIEIKNNATTDVEKPVTPENAEKQGQIIKGDTYLRKEAKWSTDKLTLLKEGTQVKIVLSDANWTKVEYKGLTGYISNDYIKQVDKLETDGLKEGEGRTLESVYLRKEANWSAEKLVVIQKNTKLSVVSRGVNWTKVKYNSYVGYIANEYIEVYGVKDPSRDEKIQAVLNLAKAQLGKPYEWGAEGPNSFDCSGLMYYIFKNGAGVTLPRTSKEQAKVGTSVAFNDMQPGDIITFDFDKDGIVTHVGIYIGQGEFLHALKPGTVVQKTSTTSTYWKNAIYNIRRVI